MENIEIALAIGIVAGIIDVIPMLIQKLDKRANWSAFLQWVFLGLVIPFVSWDIEPWIKGLIIGELAAIPIVLIVTKEDQKAMIPILVFSAILGMGVAISGAYFIN
jgi:Zn-dependent protease with chaperone function